MKAATTLTYNSPYDIKERRKIFSGFIFLAFSTASSFYILFALSMVLQAISSCFKAKMCVGILFRGVALCHFYFRTYRTFVVYMWHPYGRDTLSISNTLIG